MKKRHAHSLIELLVVLIIVGILIAIIVPAVQRSREAARMAQCIHNQGQLAKAVHMHLADEPFGRFPGYRAFAADGTTVIGWAPQIFEYLGKGNQPNDPAQATFVEVLVCPSDQGPTDQPRLNYVVNGGQPGNDSPVDGIFFDHAKDAKVFLQDRIRRQAVLSVLFAFARTRKRVS
jgi:type II secretory pathway pseudopilin PulG